jgi:3-hydroxyisobutyrate dehydrogenase-like beta-hydroxyacid dehydrogenase
MANETNTLRPISTLGFIGLGVMGEPMCGHLARRAGRPVLAHDLRHVPLARLAPGREGRNLLKSLTNVT